MNNANNCYVYGHYTKENNTLVYIGKGTGNRHYSKKNRSPLWLAYMSENSWYSVILFSGLTKSKSLKVESELIQKLNPLLNKNKNTQVIQISLQDVFYYDETSPTCLRWKIPSSSSDHYKVKQVGDVAGSLNKSTRLSRNYWKYSVTYNGVQYKVHRVIYSLFYPCENINDLLLDHINGDGIDNRISNLRVVTDAVNSRNRKKPVTNTTGTVGVSLNYYKGFLRYSAACKINGKQINKYFSVSKYGLIPAFYMACEWRKEQINLLNLSGANYSNRHGT